jgi:cysteine-S-conjugate beta-lyase
MAYSFDNTPNRRNPHILNKWTWYPKDVLPMWIADMDFSAPPAILNALEKFVKHGDMGYQLPSKSLTETIAARMHALYNWDVSPEMIVTIPGVNSGYNVAARTFCDPSRGYLIQTPVYSEFHETQKKTGIPQTESPLVKTTSANRIHYEVDFDSFEKNARGVNMFLLCNPHNPVGRIYARPELEKMAEICMANDVLIVSDEIHSELLLDGDKFHPIASLAPEIAEHTITLVSASKAFNVPGLFCAFAIIPNQGLRQMYEETIFKMGLHPGSPGLIATQVAYSGKCDGWLRELRRYLAENRDFLVEYVSKYMPGVRVTVPAATYLAWLDCTELNLAPSPYEFFLNKAHVALSDGAKYGMESSQFVRLNFGTSRRILKQGLDRMRKALRTKNLV